MANWSAPVGTKVEVTKDDGTKVETVTESMPWVVGGGAALIQLNGIVGGYSLVRVRVLPTAEQIAAPAPDGTLSLFGRAAKGA